MWITTWMYIKLVVLYLQHDKDNDTFVGLDNDSARLYGL